MAKILDNTTGAPINVSDTGITVDNVVNYTIPATDYAVWAASDDIITHIGSGDIVVNDGSNNLGKSDGIDLIKGLQSRDVDTTTGGLIGTVTDGSIERLAIDAKVVNTSPNDFLNKVTSNDTTGDYLLNKIIVADESNSTNALEVKEVNDAGDEDLKIAFDETKISITESQISDLVHATDTFTDIQVDGVSQSTAAPTLDFDSTDFLLTETPTDDFDITIKDSGIDHDQLTNFLAAEHVDWAGASAGTIHATNYTDTVYTHPNHTGDVTSTGDGAQVIANDVVTNAKAANMPAHTYKGNDTAGSADPKDLTKTELLADLNVADGANNYSHPNHTGEVTSTGDGAQVVDKTAVTNKTTVVPVTGDFVLFSDTSDSGNLKKADASDFLGGGGSDPTDVELIVPGSTTSTSDTQVLISSATLTPAAGTYRMFFTGIFSNTDATSTSKLVPYIAGVPQTVEDKNITYNHGNQSGLTLPVFLTAKGTVNGSQAFEIFWARAGGTGTMQMAEYQMVLIKVDA